MKLRLSLPQLGETIYTTEPTINMEMSKIWWLCNGLLYGKIYPKR